MTKKQLIAMAEELADCENDIDRCSIDATTPEMAAALTAAFHIVNALQCAIQAAADAAPEEEGNTITTETYKLKPGVLNEMFGPHTD